MYKRHYNLNENPFLINPDPRFLWLGKKHKEALAALVHGSQRPEGLTVLTGEMGTGKTTLINALLNQLDKQNFTAILAHPNISKLEFFNFLAESFNFYKRFTTRIDFIKFFNSFLRTACKFSRRVFIIIDEAHKISKDVLEEIYVFSNYQMVEEIRFISHIEKRYRNPLNMYLVGQNELDAVLKTRQFTILNKKAKERYKLEPFTEIETEQYVNYRLKVAGAKREIFTNQSLKILHTISGGYPREINILCENALLAGYFKGAEVIKPGIIKKCAKKHGYHG
jgi:general secretion pathway protein A